MFDILKRLKLKVGNKYICYISLYGPQGQFEYPNIVNLRTSNSKDIKESNKTITHELIHLLIYNKTKRLKLNYKQIEGIVDLFLTETDFKNIFPNYRIQNIANHNRKLFENF